MTANIPTGGFEVPEYVLWIIPIWLITLVLSGWGGYRRGLRSLKEALRIQARIEALAIADEIISDIPKQETMVPLFIKSGNELKAAAYRLSSQLSEGERKRIEKALEEYQTLQIKEHHFVMTLSTGRESQIRRADLEKVEPERKAMLESLRRLRDEIGKV
jgi:hypothetical protein